MFAIALFVVSASPLAKASDTDCAILNDWKQASAQSMTQANSIAERARIQSDEYESRKRAADLIFSEYLRGALPPDFIRKCGGSDSEQELLRRSVSAAFLKGSLDRLNQSGVPALVALSSMAENEATTSGAFFFKALSHRDEAEVDLGDRAAGFHRGRQSLFMDFQTIPPEEWLFIFVHELTHRLDPELSRAIRDYGDSRAFRQGFDLQSQVDRGEPVTSSERESLRTLLMAGLNRGLLAEYRSWTFCLSVYRSGERAGLWKNISWVSDILSLQKPLESVSAFTFRFLDPRFKDPEATGFFSLPIVRSELLEIRSQLRSSFRAPSLGALGKLLSS